MSKNRLAVYIGTFLFCVVGIVATVLGIVLSGGDSESNPVTITVQSFDFSLRMSDTQILPYNVNPEESVIEISVVEGNEFLSIDQNEKVIPIAVGAAKVKIKASFGGGSADKVITVTVIATANVNEPEPEQEEKEAEEPGGEESENPEPIEEDPEITDEPDEADNKEDDEGGENSGGEKDDGEDEDEKEGGENSESGEEDISEDSAEKDRQKVKDLLAAHLTPFFFNGETLILPLNTFISLDIDCLLAVSSDNSIVYAENNFSSIIIEAKLLGSAEITFSYGQIEICVLIFVA